MNNSAVICKKIGIIIGFLLNMLVEVVLCIVRCVSTGSKEISKEFNEAEETTKQLSNEEIKKQIELLTAQLNKED